MKTEIVLAHTAEDATDAIACAVALLRKGETVALPTETVYGLAADALNAEAVAKIFQAKHRPRFNPLIVHLPNRDWLERIARIPDKDRQLIETLIGRFWPGPFTIVLPRRSNVPEIVTGGLDTVAVRISAHPTFSSIIHAFDLPLAAPSANDFGRISPTTAQHVLDELGGRIPLIVEGEPPTHGIESTVVMVREGRITILRRGPVTEEELSIYGEVDDDTRAAEISAPGQLASHYAPKTPLRLVEDAKAFVANKNQRVGLLAWNAIESEKGYAVVRYLSKRGDLRMAAANLFRFLRELDQSDLDLIVVEQVPEEGLGSAINDRLRRAAGRG